MLKSVLSAVLIVALPAPLLAQDQAPLPVALAPAPDAQSGGVLPANTPIMLRMNQDLSSKTAQEGTMFDLSVAEEVMANGYIVIPRNAHAVGEVTWRTGKGAFGKSAKMNIELRYVEVAGRRVPISGTFRQEGEGNTVATVGGVIAAGVFAAFITGKTAVIPAGRELQAFTQSDIALAAPRRPSYSPPYQPADGPAARSAPVTYAPAPAAPAPVRAAKRSLVDPSLEIDVK